MYIVWDIKLFFQIVFYKSKFIKGLKKKKIQVQLMMGQRSKVWQIICISLILRIGLIIILGAYENVQRGQIFLTDIDYKVYSDSTKYPSPYGRHTYRYTPLLSYMMGLNYSLYQSLGKIVFAAFDALAIFVLWKIIAKVPQLLNQKASTEGQQKQRIKEQQKKMKQADFVAKLYGYNPLFIYLTVRGSCESIAMALMYGFWYFMFDSGTSGNLVPKQIQQQKIQQSQSNSMHKIYAYVIYGLWVHFRIYPIIFLPLILIYEYRNYFNQSKSKLFSTFIQMAMFAGGVFIILLAIFYYLYGQEFLNQTYLYHLTRKDNRHSFSPFFYDIYLSYFDLKPLRKLPMFLFVFIMTGQMSKKLSMFYIHFLITFGFVEFNTVITLQYYQWVFGALLLVLPQSRILTFKLHKKGFNLAIQWFLGIAIWIWMSIKVQSQGENVLFAMWVICLGKILLDLWVLLGFMKTVKIQDSQEIKKINLQEAKSFLMGKNKQQ